MFADQSSKFFSLNWGYKVNTANFLRLWKAEACESFDFQSFNIGDYSGFFSNGDTKLFEPLVNSLLYQDEYMLCADYQSYINCQDKVSQAYCDQEKWLRMSILTVSRIGKFSSDRSIREYCEKIWRVGPVHIELE